MSSTIFRRVAPFRLGILTFGILMVLIAASVSAPTVVPAHAATADRTVTLTLTCQHVACSGSWFWYQGGLTGTSLGSGSITGPAGATTRETTTQPSAADTLSFGVHGGNCGRGFTEFITPGSAINFTAIEPSHAAGGIILCSGAGSSFTMTS